MRSFQGSVDDVLAGAHDDHQPMTLQEASHGRPISREELRWATGLVGGPLRWWVGGCRWPESVQGHQGVWGT